MTNGKGVGSALATPIVSLWDVLPKPYQRLVLFPP